MSQNIVSIKIVIVGESATGKSSLLSRFVDNTFEDGFLTTIGIDYKVKTMTMDGQVVKFQLWDTAGLCRFRSVSELYYRGAHGILIVFDQSDLASILSVPWWYQEAIDKYQHFKTDISSSHGNTNSKSQSQHENENRHVGQFNQSHSFHSLLEFQDPKSSDDKSVSMDNLKLESKSSVPSVNIPQIVMVGNKSDLKPHSKLPEAVAFAKTNQIEYVSTSVKCNSGVSDPFVMIARKIIPMFQGSNDQTALYPKKSSKSQRTRLCCI